jgi:hypothetical protein
MEFEEVAVSKLKPGDFVKTYGGDFYIKNIYSSATDVTPNVIEAFGQCVTIEYTDNIIECNNSYEGHTIRLRKLDHSVQTPSIFQLTTMVKRRI